MSHRSTCYLFYGMDSEEGQKEIIRMMFPDFCQCHTVLPDIYFMVLRQTKDVKLAREKRDHKDGVS
jgi:hypothetical protein